MSQLEQLIRLYASHTVAEIASDPKILEQEFGKPIHELALAPGFSAVQDFVKTIKSSIEDDKDRYETGDRAQQIREGLKSVLRLAVYDASEPAIVAKKIDTLRDLFVLMHADVWTAEQRQHFDFVASCMRDWATYFLSYTNSGATILNDKYKRIISVYADPEVRKKRDRDKDNILADAIVHGLERRRLNRRSFYDKRTIEAGDYVAEAIAPAATRTIAFLQLIQPETFNPGKPVNWSHKEFELFRQYNEEQLKAHEAYRAAFETRFIAILLGEPEELAVEDYKIPAEFRSWKKHVFEEAHFLKLPAKKRSFDDVMVQIEDAIIYRAYKIIENVP